MIKSYEKFRIGDENKQNDFFLEVNWNKDKKISGCKMIRVTFPDGKQAYIKKEYLMAALFVIGNETEQQSMIPQKVARVKWYETVVSVVAKKNIAKGEKLTFPIKLSMPTAEEEVIRDIRYDIHRKREKGLLL